MSNNVTLPTSGVGDVNPVIAAEEISSVKYQLIKIVDGTTGDTTPIGGDNIDGGLAALSTTDKLTRRVQEQILIETIEMQINGMIASECETSHRMGFEIR